jgi:hypothetical protein
MKSRRAAQFRAAGAAADYLSERIGATKTGDWSAHGALSISRLQPHASSLVFAFIRRRLSDRMRIAPGVTKRKRALVAVNAKFSGGTLKFKVPHTAENAALVAFRSGAMNHLLPPDATVAVVRVAPSEAAAAETTIVVELRGKS